MNPFEALKESAALFRRYETLHLAKNTEESTEKARVNAAMAFKCEAALVPLRNDPLAALAIRILVAAGHVTEEKATEAFRLACCALEVEARRMNVELPWVSCGLPEIERDAQRYQWLRRQTWYGGPMAVVCNPKESVKLGVDCPSYDRLDEAIDAAAANGG